MCDVVHDGPFIVEAGPRPPTSCHFQNHTAQGPDINRPGSPWIVTADDLGGHVHRRARHRFVRLDLDLRLCKTLALASNNLCGPEVNILDDSIIIKKNVYKLVSNGLWTRRR